MRDVSVDVLGLEEFDEGHCDGYENANGYQEAQHTRYDAEAADPRFEVLHLLVLEVIVEQHRLTASSCSAS